jgi:polar amino acid transport system substrate-binding protein
VWWIDQHTEENSMALRTIPHQRHITALVITAVTVLSLTACGGSSGSANSKTTSGNAASKSRITTTWGLKPISSVADLVPAEFKNHAAKNAIYNDYPPHEFLEGNTLVGIQPDIVLALGEVMGVKFDNQSVGNFDSLIPGLVGGRYDISSADFGVTAERLARVDFVTEFAIGTGFAVKKGSAITIKEQNNLCGHSVGVIAGSYFIDQVKAASTACQAAGLKPIALQTYPNDGARTLAVTNGRTEITGTGEDALAYTIASENVPLVLQPFVYKPVVQGIALANGSKLGPAMQAAMKEIITNGTYLKILKKWGLENVAYKSPGDAVLITDAAHAP